MSCNCCRKAVSTVVVKDNGLRTYPVCNKCLKCLLNPTVVRKFN